MALRGRSPYRGSLIGSSFVNAKVRQGSVTCSLTEERNRRFESCQCRLFQFVLENQPPNPIINNMKLTDEQMDSIYDLATQGNLNDEQIAEMVGADLEDVQAFLDDAYFDSLDRIGEVSDFDEQKILDDGDGFLDHYEQMGYEEW